MREATFARPAHKNVLAVLRKLDRALLEETECFFSGGTRIVLELGEYRESRDVDFLCANREGYRRLRETATERSLGTIFAREVALAREVRADQYGIRTFIDTPGAKLKFEIVREARIDLEGEKLRSLPVPCLARKHCFAEKFLANADRGLDASTLSRDMVDLAFMIEGWPKPEAQAGLDLAKSAYGSSVMRALEAVGERLRDRAYRNRCVDGLGLADPGTLTAGLKSLSRIA